MKTKDRILTTALRQFNEWGTDKATVRSIAEEIGISHGNLCYHYKNTDALIEALYDELVNEMDIQAVLMQAPGQEINNLCTQAKHSFELLYKYRFLLLDFVRIIRRISNIKDKFRQHIQIRRVQFHMAFQLLIQEGLMKEEWAPGLYDHLITNILILGDNWINHAEIHFDQKGEEVITHYLQAFLACLIPYLTPTGFEQYREWQQNFNPE